MTAAALNPIRRLWPGPSVILAAAVAASGLTAYAIVTGRTLVAVAAAVLPLAIWEFAGLGAALILLGASLPLLMNIAGGGIPVNVAGSDLLLTFLAVGITTAAIVGHRFATFRALRPLRVVMAPYIVLVILLLPLHFGLHEVLQTGQRFELFLIPALVGAYAVLTRRHVGLLTAYVVSTSIFAVVWPLDHMGIQKNPAGQLLTNSILLLIAFKPLRKLLPCLLVLVPGLLLTQSRGAVAALVIGVAVVAFMHPSRGRTLLTRVAPMALVAAAAFTLLSASNQQRLTTFSSGTLSRAQYSVHLRHAYTRDAKRIIAAHPVTGIGIGSYVAGDALAGTQTTDPHDVVLLQAAEGGYGLAAAFVFLMVAAGALLYRLRHLDLAPVAAAVLLATLAHGLVDVYWVRGTPVLSWLLVGMVCGALYQERERGQPA